MAEQNAKRQKLAMRGQHLTATRQPARSRALPLFVEESIFTNNTGHRSRAVAIIYAGNEADIELPVDLPECARIELIKYDIDITEAYQHQSMHRSRKIEGQEAGLEDAALATGRNLALQKRLKMVELLQQAKEDAAAKPRDET